MYLIALCDDEAAELDKTGKLLGDYGKKHSVPGLMTKYFENVDELLYAVREENYMPDLIFMDIYMTDKKSNQVSINNPVPIGIEVARKLRNMGFRGKLVFLTMSKEYALEAFDVGASQYLVKPVAENKLFSVLDRFMEEVEEERKKYILLRIDGRFVRVPLNDIVFCEAQKKIQYLYLVNGTRCLLHMTMKEIYELLAGYREFVRIGVAFIVNLGYIDSMNAQELYLDNGKKVYLPRGTYKTLKEQYFRYYCEED